jgi:hypothetical protein
VGSLPDMAAHDADIKAVAMIAAVNLGRCTDPEREAV